MAFFPKIIDIFEHVIIDTVMFALLYVILLQADNSDINCYIW